jgi:hypothetical protein
MVADVVALVEAGPKRVEEGGVSNNSSDALCQCILSAP